MTEAIHLADGTPPARAALLSARELTVEFGGVKAADGVDLDIHAGEIAAIIGPNGSGKTTFLNLCTGYVKASSGVVRFEGIDILGLKPRRIARRGIARAFQLPQLFTSHTVLANVLMAIAARTGFWHPFGALRSGPAEAEARELLELVGLGAAAGRVVSTLPEGMRKLIDIVLALALRPRLLLLDEPTSGVSSQEKFAIMDTLVPILRQQGICALLVEHDMELVERYIDRVIVWNSGRVAADGPPAVVLKSQEVLENVTGGL